MLSMVDIALTLVAATTVGGLAGGADGTRQGAGSPHARIKDNVLVLDAPKLTLTLTPTFQYIGSFDFDIKAVAGGTRYIWGQVDHDKHLRRVFIVQTEGYYPGKPGAYPAEPPNAVAIAGDAYQHNVWIYDNDLNARKNPGNESERTAAFMVSHGFAWESQLVMSRFGRATDTERKRELILFYFENLKDHSAKSVADFSGKTETPEAKKILDAVDANSRAAFTIARER